MKYLLSVFFKVLKKITFFHLTLFKPKLKWIVIIVATLISLSSIIYTNTLVKQIRARESHQIEVYAASIEFLAKERETTSFILIIDEIIKANHNIPVILTNQDGDVEYYKNISKADRINKLDERQTFLQYKAAEMERNRKPIFVELTDSSNQSYGNKYIYYEDSFLLQQLKIYPYIQLTVIGIFGLIIFIIFNYLQRAEEDRLWVGLAKETAHQLATPLSSLMAWLDYFKHFYPNEKESFLELNKDINQLHKITNRFSNIGNNPKLKKVNILESIEEVVAYLQKRLPSKINITITSVPDRNLMAKINPSLMMWVIENLCKNAADAMNGKGQIIINAIKIKDGRIAIDIEDSGKGIPKSQIKTIFSPGFSTKKRGWGLGLTLAKRIINQYHKGKIFVKHSEINKGTIFRIYLNA